MTKPCIRCGSTERYKNDHCRPCSMKYRHKYYADNRELEITRRRKYREVHPEKVAETERRFKEANREKLVLKRRRYVEENLEKVTTLKRSWRQANPEKEAAQKHRRRANKRENGGTLKAADIKATYAIYPVCLACGAEENLSLDHIIPLAKAGRNSIGNIQVLCRSCNSTKGTRTIDYRDKTVIRWMQMELGIDNIVADSLEDIQPYLDRVEAQ